MTARVPFTARLAWNGSSIVAVEPPLIPPQPGSRTRPIVVDASDETPDTSTSTAPSINGVNGAPTMAIQALRVTNPTSNASSETLVESP
jgi:hypothetical protein